MKSDGKSGGLYTLAASSGFVRLLSGFYWGFIGFSLGNIEQVVGENEPVGARLSPSEPVRARRSQCREPVGARSPLSPENASPSASEPAGEENQDHGLGAHGLAGSRAPRSLAESVSELQDSLSSLSLLPRFPDTQLGAPESQNFSHDRIGRRADSCPTIHTLSPVGEMGSIYDARVRRIFGSGVVLDCGDDLSCHVEVLRPDVIRVLFLRNEKPRQPNTWTIVPSPREDVPWEGADRLKLTAEQPAFEVDVKNVDGIVRVSTSAVQLHVTLSPLHFQWHSADGKVFATDRISRPYGFGTKTSVIRHYMSRSPKDQFFGLGDKTGALNLAGRRLRTVMTDALGYDPESGDPLYKHWPFLIVRDEPSGVYYGVLYDNMSAATFDLGCEHGNYFGLYRIYEAEDGDLDYYMIAGPGLAHVVSTHVELTGGMALGPRWTLGYHCTAMPLADAENAQEKTAAFIADCQENRVPCSAFHFGSGYTSIGSKRYVFNWNLKKFPDPKRLIGQFRAAGMRVVANLKPCLLSDHPKYEDVAKSGAFIKDADTGGPSISQFWDGEGAHLDFTNPAAVKWWRENLQTEILDYGISSAWNDNNEYELSDESAECHRFGSPTPLPLLRPLHSLLMTRSSYQQQAEHCPGERVYTISRAGCPGIQRYAQTWSGDNTTSWETLRFNLRTGLQLSLSGAFNIGHDVGGFAGPTPSPELLVRWVQTGLLHPRFIMNSWKADNTVTTPWMHPRVTPYIRWAIRLRYRLMPYIYSLYRTAAERHEPIVRPTFYDFPEDDRCREENDDLMLGPSLLAAPVVQEGGRQRQVYLPRGPPGWYDFYSEEYFESGQMITVAAPLDRLPLFVPAGSVIPLTNQARDFGELHDEPSRILRAFPALAGLPGGRATGGRGGGVEGGAEGSRKFFELWEDDGLSRPGGVSDFSILKLSVAEDETNGSICVTVEHGGGTYSLPYDTITVSTPLADTRPVSIVHIGESAKLRVCEGEFEMHSLGGGL